jgi:predicted metal-binding membrane protein
MLVMFGIGVGNLAGMVALTGVMVIEKTVPGNKRLSPFIGIILLLLGVSREVQQELLHKQRTSVKRGYF